MTPDRGHIIRMDFTPHKGHEQSGRRPALVVSPALYNGVSNCLLVCPITSNTSPWPWKVMLPKSAPITGAVLVDQIKSIDAEARNVEDCSQIASQAIMDEVLALLATLTA